MKSRFPVRAYVVALLMSAGIFFFISCSQSEGGNWKEYFQDTESTYYYYNDSIHYPQQKKTLLGITVHNKEIVNVWTRWTSKKDGEIGKAWRKQIYCAERECKGCGLVSPLSTGFSDSDRKEAIEPGSEDEGLLKKVCP